MGRFAAVVTGLCLVLTACGGKKAEKPRLTKSSFAAAANAICTVATTRAWRLDRLRALRPPRTDEDLYRRWLGAEEDALAAARALAHPEQDDEEERDPFVPLVIAEGKAAGYARRLGAEACVTMPG